MKKIVAKMTAVSLFVVTIGSIVIPQAQTVDAKTPVMKKKIEITKGKSKTLKVTGKYIKSCRFKTTDSRVVRVNQKGKVTAKKVGKCKIKAWIKYRANQRSRKILKKTLVCAVTVKAVSPIQTEEPSDFVASDSFVGQNAEFSVKRGSPHTVWITDKISQPPMAKATKAIIIFLRFFFLSPVLFSLFLTMTYARIPARVIHTVREESVRYPQRFSVS